MFAHTKIVLLFTATCVGLIAADTLEAAEIIPVSQLREVYADATVMPPTQQEFESKAAPDFGKFNEQVNASVLNANAVAEAIASQHSTIDACAITGSGTTFAHSMVSANGYLALSVTLSRSILTFDVDEQVEILIAGTLHAESSSQGRVALVKDPNIGLFERIVEDGTLGVHHRRTLEPGRYVVSFSSGTNAGATDSKDVIMEGDFDLVLTLCFIPADVNVDNQVNVDDLLAMINAWGVCPIEPQPCAADINLDGLVDVSDLLEVINAWSA